MIPSFILVARCVMSYNGRTQADIIPTFAFLDSGSLPRDFVPRSDVEDDTWFGYPAPKFHTTTIGGRLPTTSDLTCSRSHTRQIFSEIRFRTRNVPSGSRPHHYVTTTSQSCGTFR
ncbi:hypothetical protein AVEN_214248-1 [Araneus ventricosus]|uniref:Uncharacterized protein n=1 Tax=Araneus ventricosus TaxID=182803 RepID=A0A4Y2RF14_ARAVE|nr:hypothetical protein AVEN_214248-1 [Araneus ventricosus]